MSVTRTTLALAALAGTFAGAVACGPGEELDSPNAINDGSTPVGVDGGTEGSVAAILHHDRDAGWVPVAVGEPGEPAILKTTDFSPYLIGVIPIPGWLQRGSDTISGAVRDLFSKRADPPDCRDAPPDWVDLSPASIDAVLSCATTTNVDRSTGPFRLGSPRKPC